MQTFGCGRLQRKADVPLPGISTDASSLCEVVNHSKREFGRSCLPSRTSRPSRDQRRVAVERTYFNNDPRLHPARQINKKLSRCSRFPRNQNAELANSITQAGTPKHSTTSEKGEIMTVFQPLDANSADWPEPLAVNCTITVRVTSRLTSEWLDEDFLCWSSRQKDAEIVVEYDV